MAEDLLRGRSGELVRQFTAARPVTDWQSAFDAHKAISRLVRLCRTEHEATRLLLAALDEPHLQQHTDALDRLLRPLRAAFAEIERAIKVGAGDD